MDAGGAPSLPLAATRVPSYAASLAFHGMELSSGSHSLQVLAGLGNGSLLTIDTFLDADGSARLGEPKSTSVGQLPVRLTSARGLKSGLEQNLITAISERLTLLFEDRDRLAHSSISRPVSLQLAQIDVNHDQDLTSAVTARAPGIGSCLVIAAQQSLTFSTVTSLKKLHVQKVSPTHSCADFRWIWVTSHQ